MAPAIALRAAFCQGLCCRPPVVGLRGPSQATRGSVDGCILSVWYLEADELQALLEAPDCTTRDGRRDRTLLLTMFNTGARVQEILDLRPGDLHLERPPQVRPPWEGRKERLCPLRPQTVQDLHTPCYENKATSLPGAALPFRRALPAAKACACGIHHGQDSAQQTSAPALAAAHHRHPPTPRRCRSDHYQPLARSRQCRDYQPLCHRESRHETCRRCQGEPAR